MTSSSLANATFKHDTCDVCGISETNQFFNISDSFIDFAGKYINLQHILKECLDIQLGSSSNKQQEICVDCQEKVFKFFHFKHKVKTFQNRSIDSNKVPLKRPKFKSRIIHRISDIIEDFTKSCSISSILVDKEHKRLVIESDDGSLPIYHDNVKQEPLDELSDDYWEDTSNNVTDFLGISIIEEPSDSSDVMEVKEVKKEPSDLPVIVSCSTLQVPEPSNRRSRRRNGQFDLSREGEKNVSQAALKMRAYRERLKTPGNEMRMLRMMQKQREWNRNYYIRKQMSTGQPIRSRRRRTDFDIEDICNRRSF